MVGPVLLLTLWSSNMSEKKVESREQVVALLHDSRAPVVASIHGVMFKDVDGKLKYEAPELIDCGVTRVGLENVNENDDSWQVHLDNSWYDGELLDTSYDEDGRNKYVLEHSDSGVHVNVELTTGLNEVQLIQIFPAGE